MSVMNQRVPSLAFEGVRTIKAHINVVGMDNFGSDSLFSKPVSASDESTKAVIFVPSYSLSFRLLCPSRFKISPLFAFEVLRSALGPVESNSHFQVA